MLVTSVALQGEVDVTRKPCGSLQSSQDLSWILCLERFCCSEPLLGCLSWSLAVKGKVNGEGTCFCFPLPWETVSTCAGERVLCTGEELCGEGKTSLCY